MLKKQTQLSTKEEYYLKLHVNRHQNMPTSVGTGHYVQAVYISRSYYWVLNNKKKEQVHL